ncbi:hypothetical protein ACLPHM_04585 [Paenalcaligenes sp. Me131]|uniref:hypothetical protein n=1 Tax=Paenalcaligenes sp. Me131 TaxID=3392636 RepID=UPI003D2BB87D
MVKLVKKVVEVKLFTKILTMGMLCVVGNVHASAVDFPDCAAMAYSIGAPVISMIEIVNPEATEGYFNTPRGEGRLCIWKLDMAGKELITAKDYAASIGLITAEIKRDPALPSKEEAKATGAVHDVIEDVFGNAWVWFPYPIADLEDELGVHAPKLVVDNLSVEVSSTFFPDILTDVDVAWAIKANKRLYQLYLQQLTAART